MNLDMMRYIDREPLVEIPSNSKCW